MWEHILTAHLPVKKDDDDKWVIDEEPKPPRVFTCHWGGCRHFAHETNVSPSAASHHIQTHLPDTSPDAAMRRQHNRDSRDDDVRSMAPRTFMSTQADGRNDAEGLPLTSALVLRNLARQVAKLERGAKNGNNDNNQKSWVADLFAPFRDDLFEVFTHNRVLMQYMHSLIDTIETGHG
jgi:chromatin structure-remodeling complex subunit RSC9